MFCDEVTAVGGTVLLVCSFFKKIYTTFSIVIICICICACYHIRIFIYTYICILA